jgi:DNA polymerase-3 subunit delta'
LTVVEPGSIDDSSSGLDWPFAALPWQADAWERLCRACRDESMAHALLLSGSAGIGKTDFARALTALLLCQQAGESGACGQCRSCHLLEAGTHSDFLQLSPEANSRVIKINQVRSLIDFANQTAALGQRKVVLINPAEVLNLSAANALLKCLEEPSVDTYLLLVSHASGLLPATIRSRCQKLAMPVPTAEQSRAWLDGFTEDGASSAALLEVTGNRPAAALELLRSGALEQQQALQKALDALLDRSISAVDFPALVGDLETGEVLGLLAGRLEASIKADIQDRSKGLRGHFLLLDELRRLQRALLHGGNPNRQLTIETCAAQLAMLLGAGR